MDLNKLLTIDKAPYVVTLAVAVIGFLVNQTLGRYDKIAIIEYSIRIGSAMGDVDAARPGASYPEVAGTRIHPITVVNTLDRGYVLELRNISSAVVIRCTRFLAIKSPEHFAPPPTVSYWMLSSSADSLVKTSNSGKLEVLEFTVFDMQPGAEVQLRLNGRNIQTLIPVASPCADSDVPPGTTTGQLPVIKRSSWETVFIKYALDAFWLGLVVWVLSLSLFFWHRMRRDDYEA